MKFMGSIGCRLKKQGSSLDFQGPTSFMLKKVQIAAIAIPSGIQMKIICFNLVCHTILS